LREKHSGKVCEKCRRDPSFLVAEEVEAPAQEGVGLVDRHKAVAAALDVAHVAGTASIASSPLPPPPAAPPTEDTEEYRRQVEEEEDEDTDEFAGQVVEEELPSAGTAFPATTPLAPPPSNTPHRIRTRFLLLQPGMWFHGDRVPNEWCLCESGCSCGC
jgi:hypothetical protein